MRSQRAFSCSGTSSGQTPQSRWRGQREVDELRVRQLQLSHQLDDLLLRSAAAEVRVARLFLRDRGAVPLLIIVCGIHGSCSCLQRFSSVGAAAGFRLVGQHLPAEPFRPRPSSCVLSWKLAAQKRRERPRLRRDALSTSALVRPTAFRPSSAVPLHLDAAGTILPRDKLTDQVHHASTGQAPRAPRAHEKA